MLHTTLALSVFAICLWAIISPVVHTGVLGTIGLCLIGAGALLNLDELAHRGLMDLMLAGVLCAGLHVVWRVLITCRHQPRMRRLSDWGPHWSATAPPGRVDITNQQHIAGGRK